jgi:hypothetical protein
MLSNSPPTFDLLREHVEALMETGEPFTDVERTIDATALPEDHKAALWLLAWSLDGGGESRPAEPARPRLTVLS